MPRFARVLAPLLVGLLSLACTVLGATVTPVPGTPTVDVPALTVTRIAPEPTNTAAPPPTAPPSPSPAPLEPTATAAPTGLNATGPYVLFRAQSGVWIANPDGSFPTQLTTFASRGDLRAALSPAGDRLALVQQTDAGLDLVLVQVPGGDTQTIAHLSTFTPEAEIQDPINPAAFAVYAIRDYDSVAWQPGAGRLLAFIGAIHGPTADVYLYDTQTQAITQLTDGQSQAVLPSWSPDGQYILHAGVSWVPPFGGAILGANQFDAVWAIRVADGALLDQPKAAGVLPNFVGWTDAGHYLIFDSDETCTAQNLRTVDVATGAATPVMEFSFSYYIDLSPENNVLLFASAAGCATSLGDGVFLLRPGLAPPTQLLDKTAYGIEWLPESQVFEAYPEALFTADGQTRYDPPVYDKSFNPAVSRAGDAAWEVIENQQGRVVVQSPGSDWQTVMDGSVAYLLWDPLAARTLLIALRDGSLYSATYPDFAPVAQGNLGGIVDQAMWVPSP